MNKWLSQTEPKNIPSYAFTNIGVGGVVIDDNDRVLVVKEKHFIAKQMWKFPGGYALQGEELGETAVREVREETGISCQFKSIIAFRHFHKFAFGCSDLYIVCHLKPLKDSNESQESQTSSELQIKKCEHEIAECQWIPIEELKPQLSQFNLFVIEKFLSNRKNNVNIGLDNIEAIIKNINQTVYSIHTN
jgi:ADP-ribose pyrophosphatase YjhB (NUDIX family)